MGIIVNGTELDSVYYNDVEISEVYFNDVKVYPTTVTLTITAQGSVQEYYAQSYIMVNNTLYTDIGEYLIPYGSTVVIWYIGASSMLSSDHSLYVDDVLIDKAGKNKTKSYSIIATNNIEAELRDGAEMTVSPKTNIYNR